MQLGLVAHELVLHASPDRVFSHMYLNPKRSATEFGRVPTWTRDVLDPTIVEDEAVIGGLIGRPGITLWARQFGGLISHTKPHHGGVKYLFYVIGGL